MACKGLARGEAEPRALIEKTRNEQQAKGVMGAAQTSSAQRHSSKRLRGGHDPAVSNASATATWCPA